MPARAMGAKANPGGGGATGPSTPEAALRQAQGVSLALAIGLLLGGGLLAFLGLSRAGAAPVQPAQPPFPGNFDVFQFAVPIFGAIAVAAVVLTPGWLLRAAQTRWEARADDEAAMKRVYGGFIVLTTIQAAMLEGAGLFGAAAANITGNALYLIAPLVAVIFLAILFPRTARISRWIDEVTGHPPTGPAIAPPASDEEAA